MKEKRTIRKELLLTPAEHAQMSAAAEQAGLSLSAWLVMAANKWLEIERANFAFNQFNNAGDGTNTER